MIRSLMTTTVAGLALALAACGDSSDEGTTATTHSAAEARTEAAETKTAIEAALKTYAGGDAAAAEEAVSEAYVGHFEDVEHTLEEKDAELTEELEEAISTELRDAMKAKDDAKVTSLGAEIVADLEKAEGLLS